MLGWVDWETDLALEKDIIVAAPVPLTWRRAQSPGRGATSPTKCSFQASRREKRPSSQSSPWQPPGMCLAGEMSTPVQFPGAVPHLLLEALPLATAQICILQSVHMLIGILIFMASTRHSFQNLSRCLHVVSEKLIQVLFGEMIVEEPSNHQSL